MTVEEFNLLLRCFSIGNLILFATLCVGRKLSLNIILLLGLFVGFINYIILTAPIPNEVLLDYRNVLLFFTELLPVLIFLFVVDFSPAARAYQHYNQLRASFLALALLIYGICFLLLDGEGMLHSLSHINGLVLLIASVYLCFSQINDDLVSKRRKYRFIFGSYLMLHFCVLVIFELASSQSDAHAYLGLTNSGLIFLATLVGLNIHVRESQLDEPVPSITAEQTDAEPAALTPAVKHYADKLALLMTQGAYLENGLTIGKLAEQLDLPEHRLRKLINEGLGFKNFSSYLNSYRIPQACDMLRRADLADTPILTIALELGFGSISPFNRSFKSLTGKTPTEYREQNLCHAIQKTNKNQTKTGS